MAGITIQRRRGTTSDHTTFKGAEGELTIDSTKWTAVVHDGITDGGFPLSLEDHTHAIATDNLSGFLSAADKTKLDLISSDPLKYQTIQVAEVPQPQRAALDFSSSFVAVDDSVTNKTTINLKTSGVTAGRYSKVDVNALGQITAGYNLAVEDIPILTSENISDLTSVIQNNRLDQFEVPTNSLSLNQNKLINVADPTLSTDAATKNYVDNIPISLTYKQACKVASTGTNINIINAPASIDGIVLNLNDRILLKDQIDPTTNGIWSFTQFNFPLVRANDANVNAQFQNGMFTLISEGQINAGYAFVLTAQNTIILGTTPLMYSPVGTNEKLVNNAGVVYPNSISLSSDLINGMRPNIKSFGAKGDLKTFVSGGSLTLNSNILTSVTPVFNALTDIGKTVCVNGAAFQATQSTAVNAWYTSYQTTQALTAIPGVFSSQGAASMYFSANVNPSTTATAWCVTGSNDINFSTETLVYGSLITNVTSNPASGPATLSVNSGHGINAGNHVYVFGVTGATFVNGTFLVESVTSTTIKLHGAIPNVSLPYTGGGFVMVTMNPGTGQDSVTISSPAYSYYRVKAISPFSASSFNFNVNVISNGFALSAIIQSVQSPTQCTLNTHAPRTISNVPWYFGTDDTAAFQNALAAIGANELFLPAGKYLISQSFVLSNNQILYGVDAGASQIVADVTFPRPVYTTQAISASSNVQTISVDNAASFSIGGQVSLAGKLVTLIGVTPTSISGIFNFAVPINTGIIPTIGNSTQTTYCISLGTPGQTTPCLSTRLEKLTIDCNHIPNLGAVYSSSIQDSSGVFDCAIINWNNFGVYVTSANAKNFSLKNLILTGGYNNVAPRASIIQPAAVTPPLATVTPVGTHNTVYAIITYVTATGESFGTLEVALLLGTTGSLASIISPPAANNAVGWNCYLSVASQLETLQNSTPIAIGTNFNFTVGTYTTSGKLVFTAYYSASASPQTVYIDNTLVSYIGDFGTYVGFQTPPSLGLGQELVQVSNSAAGALTAILTAKHYVGETIQHGSTEPNGISLIGVSSGVQLERITSIPSYIGQYGWGTGYYINNSGFQILSCASIGAEWGVCLDTGSYGTIQGFDGGNTNFSTVGVISANTGIFSLNDIVGNGGKFNIFDISTFYLSKEISTSHYSKRSGTTSVVTTANASATQDVQQWCNSTSPILSITSSGNLATGGNTSLNGTWLTPSVNPNRIVLNNVNFPGTTSGGVISVNSEYRGNNAWAPISSNAYQNAMFATFGVDQFGVTFGPALLTAGDPQNINGATTTELMVNRTNGTTILRPILKTIAPPTHTNSSGIQGQIAYDSSGNFYLCYATNAWAKFTGNISF